MDLTDTQARLHPGDVYELSEEQGRRTESSNVYQGQSSDYQPPQTTEQKLALRFAREVANYMRGPTREKRFQRLVVAAPPQFLGALRSELDPGTRAMISLELAKDLSKMRADELRAYLPERF